MEKYDNTAKCWFDDDNNMSYRYILSSPLTEIDQLDTVVMKIKGNR